MLIIALILIVVAIGCWFAYRSAKAKMGEILYVPSSRIEDIAERATAVSEALGEGYSSDYTEIKGEMISPELLKAPLSEKECVYYRSRISREWEEEETYRDQDGEQQTRTNTGSDTLFSDQDWVRFQVDDGSGSIWIDPEDADIDLSVCVNRTEPQNAVTLSRNILKAGDLRIEVSAPALAKKRRITGYSFHEEIFEPEGDLYLLGTVVDKNGDLTLVHPAEKGQHYVISHKSEEELVAGLESSSQWYFWGSVASGILSIILAVIGLVTGNLWF